MSEAETAWQDLLTAALLGTGRRPPAPVRPSGDALSQFLAGLDASDTQHFLLQAAAAVALYRQAGSLPARLDIPTLPACDPDEMPRCKPAAAARLARMLGGDYKSLIPEWLALAAAAYQRAPEELLPDLLEWGEAHLDQVDAVLPVLGKRGRWLAKQVPWVENMAAAVFAETVPAGAAQTVWQTGRKQARRLLLRRLRQTDPALALGLVASTWAEENAEERKAFLDLFEAGLSPADEPFLEAALDDRSKEVRRLAAELLARLPASRLAQRQAERARALVKWKPGGFLRKAQIEVMLPEACDKDMLRDGVEPKRPGVTWGEKTDWLFQILSAVPPVTWSKQWAKSPAELLDAAADGDWKELLHQSWISAALRHPDPGWVEAILRAYPDRSHLLDALPPNRRVAFLADQIRSRPKEGMGLLENYRAPWGSELSRLALPHLQTYYLADGDAPRFGSPRMDGLAISHFMHPSLAPQVDREYFEKAEPGTNWARMLESLLQFLSFRRQMMEEFR